MSNVKISVVVPTKNSAATLEVCLESITSQSYDNIELIVVDNYSTDETPVIAKKYANNFFSKGPERSTQRNYGVSQSSGKYVVIIDSDMTLSQDVIKHCVEKMKDSTTVGVVIPEESYGTGFWAQCKKLERSFYIGVSYMEAARFFRRSDYIRVGGYDESMISGEDWDLSQRIEQLGTFSRIDDLIFHNEGHISLLKTIKKKYYYAQKFAAYQAKNHNNPKVDQQTGILRRYILFLSKPQKLFRNPILGIGMLFMKTCEFLFGGAGYLKAKLQSS